MHGLSEEIGELREATAHRYHYQVNPLSIAPLSFRLRRRVRREIGERVEESTCSEKVWLMRRDCDRSELEVLEKDMKTLRDTIIAREEAWDKAMEREHNYRQQLTRLTTETITARHLSETRCEELKSMTNALSVILVQLGYWLTLVRDT